MAQGRELDRKNPCFLLSGHLICKVDMFNLKGIFIKSMNEKA